MSITARHRQLCFNEGSPGSFAPGTIAAAYAKLPTYDLNYAPTVNRMLRKPSGIFLSSPPSGGATIFYTLSFRTPICGSGTPGAAPVWGLLLKACGFSETTISGASFTQPIADTRNLVPSLTPLALAGTNDLGVGSGRLEIIVEALGSAPDTITLGVYIYGASPNDNDYAQVALTTTSPVSIGATALTLAVGTGTFSDTYTNLAVGDTWYAKVYDDAQVIYDLEEPAAALSVPVLDMAVIEGTTSGGQVLKLRDCRGNVRFNFDQTSGPGFMEFEFTGIPDESPVFTSQALLTSIVYTDVIPPTFKGVTTSFFSGTPQAYTNLMIDVGNTVSTEEDAQGEFGHNTTDIVDRETTGSINPLRAVPATFESSAKLIDQTQGTLSWTVGSASGNTHAFNVPKIQLNNDSDEEREGRLVTNLSFDVVRPDYDAGGDYDTLTITLT
jgi:hypothetical protein